ncbi:MAG: hypothetical protein H6Q86_836 [candidate division NC10 bacterium]|nr:hypothetical protein [candidate division NC10 bacterium]
MAFRKTQRGVAVHSALSVVYPLCRWDRYRFETFPFPGFATHT